MCILGLWEEAGVGEEQKEQAGVDSLSENIPLPGLKPGLDPIVKL